MLDEAEAMLSRIKENNAVNQTITKQTTIKNETKANTQSLRGINEPRKRIIEPLCGNNEPRKRIIEPFRGNTKQLPQCGYIKQPLIKRIYESKCELINETHKNYVMLCSIC